MKSFAQRRPVLFEILLIVAALVLAAAGGIAFQAAGAASGLDMACGRILAGVVLLIAFRHCFDMAKSLRGFFWMLPALVFALWNVANHFITKGPYHPPTVGIFLLALASAVFEEVVFRGIFIHNLKASGKSDLAALLVSAILFGALHLTNAVSGGILQALVQTGYATVVGLVFGAIYIRTGDILSVMIAHTAIDMASGVFEGAGKASLQMLAAFVVMLVVMAACSFCLIPRKPEQ